MVAQLQTWLERLAARKGVAVHGQARTPHEPRGRPRHGPVWTDGCPARLRRAWRL